MWRGVAERHGSWRVRLKSGEVRGAAERVCLTADCFAFGELLLKSREPDQLKVTKSACSRLGPSFVRVPSLRSCSVGPRRTDIHVLTALSRHPCRSAHSSRPAFSLHPSRVWRCLDLLCTKIKSRSKASRLKPVPLTAHGFLVGPASAGNKPVHAPAFLDFTRCLSRTGFSREEPCPFAGRVWRCTVPGNRTPLPSLLG